MRRDFAEENVSTTFDLALAENKEIIVVGDFNFNILSNEPSSIKWLEKIEDLGLTQLVMEPTRIKGNSSTLIDHILVSHPNSVSTVKVMKCGNSDHFPICMTYKGSISKNRDINLIEYRSLKTLDVDLFKYDLENAPWSLIETCDDVDVMIDHFEMIFLNVLNTHATIKRRRVKHPRIPEWKEHSKFLIIVFCRLQTKSKQAFLKDLFGTAIIFGFRKRLILCS